MEIAEVEKVIENDGEYKITALKNTNLMTKVMEIAYNLGGQVISFSSEKPTLENVFLALTGKQLRE